MNHSVDILTEKLFYNFLTVKEEPMLNTEVTKALFTLTLFVRKNSH